MQKNIDVQQSNLVPYISPSTILSTQEIQATPPTPKVWRVCIYVRLSRDDGDKAESDSITNQKSLIHDYVKTRPYLEIRSERVDDGFSGVSFSRPGFLAMMDDIEAGIIDCIIVKDLSRFGRNWIDSGRYIEQIFPFMGVRFIAINDYYDSEVAKASNDNITLPFKNLINDAYAKDISTKIRSQFDTKRKNGDFIGSFAVYGYEKDENNRNKLVVDDFAAGVVRDIFKWRIEGMSNQGIANHLNEMGILSPHEYKREKGLRVKSHFKTSSKATWSANSIARILKNQVYLGVMEQGKRTSKSYKLKKGVDVPKEEWVRVENTHEGIINPKDFELVAQLLGQDTRKSPLQNEVYLFAGLLKCKTCRQNMVRKIVPSGDKKYAYYVCSTNRQTKTCKPHSISEKQLEKSVLYAVRTHLSHLVEYSEIMKFIDMLPLQQQEAKKIEQHIAAKEKELYKYQLRNTRLIEDLQDGIIDRGEYKTYKANFTALCHDAEKALDALKAELDNIAQNTTGRHEWIEHFLEHRNFQELSRHVLVNLVEKIFVGDKNRIVIRFRYQNQFEALAEMVTLQSSSLVYCNQSSHPTLKGQNGREGVACYGS
ncbi:MAG: recombinase family protein [Defluviitaleaceae bacterium]|nr:recombinase family protein [Defluviitaleaceae bacterium]